MPIKRDGRGLSSCPSAGGGDSCVAGRVVFRKRYLSFFFPREVSMKYSPTAPKNNYDMNGPSVGSCSSIFTSLPYLFTISGFFISIFIIFGHFRSVVRAVSTFSHILFCQMTHFVINCYHPLSFSGILKPSEPNKHKQKAQDFFIKKQNKTYIYIYYYFFYNGFAAVCWPLSGLLLRVRDHISL